MLKYGRLTAFLMKTPGRMLRIRKKVSDWSINLRICTDRIYENIFSDGMTKIRRNMRIYQEFLSQSAGRFAKKPLAISYWRKL